MTNRIEIELTSEQADGTWTWRAKGARHPRGTLDGSLVPDGTSPGTTLRAEVEGSLDGLAILALLPPTTKRPEPERLEILGGRRPSPGVTTTVIPRRGDRGREGPARRQGPDAGRGRAQGGPARRDGTDTQRAGRPPGRAGHAGGRRDAGRTGAGGRRDADRTDAGAAPRFAWGDRHRKELVGILRPEQIPVAEQLMQGGMPAVRRAIAHQVEGQRPGEPSAVSSDALVAMAEELLPRVNLASWLDRAEAASQAPDDVPLRDLRSVVTAASAVTLDDAGRATVAELRTVLQRRVEEQRERWQSSITTAIKDGEILDALARAGRPPEPAARFSAEIAMQLSAAAGAALSEDVPPDEWLALLSAVIGSPVRRTVKPAALPRDADAAFREECRRVCGQVPALAKLLGIAVPPPPGPARTSTIRVVHRPPHPTGRPSGGPRNKGATPPTRRGARSGSAEVATTAGSEDPAPPAVGDAPGDQATP